MNIVQILSSQGWVERLGWTLVHFFWQGFLIAGFYAAARRAMARTSSSNARYVLSCLALVAMMIAPLVTWDLMQPSGVFPDPAYRIRSNPPDPSTIAAATALPASQLTIV